MITEDNQLCNELTDPKEIYCYDYVLEVMKTFQWEDFIGFINDEIQDKVFSCDKSIIESEMKERDGVEIA